MTVHIVCPNTDPERSILYRLALALADATGWTLGSEPRDDARLNYFFPYLALADQDWTATPTAAYFTHRESDAWPKKQAMWDDVDSRVDLRLTSSRHNLAHLGEPVALVPRPPIDRDAFKIIGRRPSRKRPVIGLSGFVDALSGRKGEHLVSHLQAAGLDCEIRAIGKGWPVETKLIPWAAVPYYYNDLDFYLCTATNEGVPMTVLEALACGIPAIIPQNVGIMGDLPAIHGIYRYRAGDRSDLVDTVRIALEDRPASRKALRAITEAYNAENWAADHQRAVDDFLYPGRIGPDWHERAGMYCVGFGEPSRRCAVTCIKSFKEQMPGVPVTFAGVEPLSVEDLFIRRDDTDIGGRLAKLAVYDEAPEDWHYVLYLDADTETVADVSFLFQLLADGWEAVICRDMDKYAVAENMIRPDNEAEFQETIYTLGHTDLMQYNGGVFGFRRCENVRRFFALWHDEWQKYGGRDQGALLRALYQNPLRLFVLGNQWNASDRYPEPPGGVAIWHHSQQARRWDGLIFGRTDDADAWQRVRRWERQNG